MMDWAKGAAMHWQDSALSRRLPVIVALLLILLVAQYAATLTWRFLPGSVVDEPAVAAVEEPDATPLPARQQPVALATRIVQWHLFGEVRPDEPKPVVQVEAAPDTQLNLKLRGVFASSVPNGGRAIIADAGGREDAYSVGDEVAAGVKLNRIFPDRVLLERNGRLEALRLPEDERLLMSQAEEPEAMEGAPLAEAGEADVVVAPNTDRAELLRQYRSQLLSNPQSMMGLVRADPFNRDGRLIGWRIRPGRDRQLLQQFGLQSGDVVTAVNGVQIDNPIKALEVLRDLSSASQISLNIERNGAPQSLVFQIE
jgi:general secretion pathway protein C